MFVAVWPDDSTLDRLAALPLGPTDALRMVTPGQWHVTLRFLGDVDTSLVPDLVHALEAATEELPGSIPCEVGPGTAWFGGDRVLHIPVSGLDRAAVDIREATVPIVPDLDPVNAHFTGHLTVARTKRGRLAPPERSALTGVALATSFYVDSIDLVGSQAHPGGVRYTTLARVPLRGRPARS
jgi:RNA 2',3'-cyclic 3'-phosphodiesterase